MSTDDDMCIAVVKWRLDSSFASSGMKFVNMGAKLVGIVFYVLKCQMRNDMIHNWRLAIYLSTPTNII